MTDLNARYGKKPAKSRRNTIVLAAGLLALFLAWSVSVNFFTPTEHKDFSGEAVEYLSNTDFETTAEIRLSGFGALGTIHCTAKALDPAYAVVGFKEFDTRFAGQQELRFELSINTTSKASSVVVESCSLK